MRLVLLCPTLEVTQTRHAARTGKAFDTRNLAPMIAALRPAMPPADDHAAGWRVLETSNLGVAQTVELLLA